MIQIYKPKNTNYNVNGDMTLTPTIAALTAEINGSWVYTLEHPIDDLGRWRYIEENAVIKAPSMNGDQLFRIKATNKTEYMVSAEAEPIGMDAKDDLFIKDIKINNKNCQAALNQLFAINRKYTGVSDITKKATAYYVYCNLIEALNSGDNAVLKRWGGELSYDNYTIKVLNRIGEDRGQEIRYGKNIPADGFKETVDMRGVVTRIYPTAYNGYTLSGAGYVDSGLISKYPIVKAATIQYNNVKMAVDEQEGDREKGIIICEGQAALDSALRAKCRAEYNNGIDKPSVTIDANMVLLQDVIGYEEYKNLVKVELGDTIHCYHTLLGIITDARVTQLTYDSITEKVTQVKLTTGGVEYNYFNDVSRVVNEANKAFNNGANGVFLVGDKEITITRGIITGIS